MKRFLLAVATMVVLMVPAVLLGEALDFGGTAWLATVVVVMVLGSLVDLSGFYGTQHQPRSR